MISFRSFRKKINENSNFDSFLISEMAVPHHIRRTHHANIDEEDLNFLKQFPLDYWASARQQRYEKLWEMLKKLDNHRKENLKVKEIEEKIDSGLKKFVKTGDLPEELEKLFNEKIISYRYKDYWTNAIKEKGNEAFSDRDIQLESERIASDYVKKQTEQLLEDDPEDPDKEVEFNNLRGYANKGKGITISASPYLKRLYHKLETTPGEMFDLDSNLLTPDEQPRFKSLGSRGKHGLDLRNPQVIKGTSKDEDKYVTSGWVMPKEQSVRNNLYNYLKYNAAGIFGDMPRTPEEMQEKKIVYKPIDVADTFAADKTKTELIKQYRKDIKDENLSLPSDSKYTLSQIETMARERANDRLILLAQEGKLFADPVPVLPGEDPIERKITVKDTVKKDRYGNTIKTKTLVYPNLYFPFKKHGKREIPLVKPGFHFRELGTRHRDHDELGELAEKIKDKLTGHNKNYVKASEQEYLNKPHNISGSGDLYNAHQQNSQILSKANHEYEYKYGLVFPEDEKKVDLEWDGSKFKKTPNGQYNISIIEGILKCLQSRACGGKSSYEQRHMENNIKDYYQDMIVLMMENLDDPSLYEEDGRTKWVFNKTSHLIQKDIGGGPRRNRRKEAKSINASEVDTFTDSDVKPDGRTKNKDSINRAVDRFDVSDKRRRGEKNFFSLAGSRDKKIEEKKGKIESLFEKLQKDKSQWAISLKGLANTIDLAKDSGNTSSVTQYIILLDEELHLHIMEILEEFGKTVGGPDNAIFTKKDADINSFNIFRKLKSQSANLADLIDVFLDYDLIQKTTDKKDGSIKIDEKEFQEFKKFDEIKPMINFNDPKIAEDLIDASSLTRREKDRLKIYLDRELNKKEAEAEAEAKVKKNQESPTSVIIGSGLKRRAAKTTSNSDQDILKSPEVANGEIPSADWLNSVKNDKDYNSKTYDPIRLAHHPKFLENSVNEDNKKDLLKKLKSEFSNHPYYKSARSYILNALEGTPISTIPDEDDETIDEPVKQTYVQTSVGRTPVQASVREKLVQAPVQASVRENPVQAPVQTSVQAPVQAPIQTSVQEPVQAPVKKKRSWEEEI